MDAGFNSERLLLFRIDATSAGSRVALLSHTRQNMTFAIAGQDAQPDVTMNVLTNGTGLLSDALGLR